jgi:hypothetical protein
VKCFTPSPNPIKPRTERNAAMHSETSTSYALLLDCTTMVAIRSVCCIDTLLQRWDTLLYRSTMSATSDAKPFLARLPPQLAAQLAAKARDEDRTQSSFVRRAIAAALADAQGTKTYSEVTRAFRCE